MSNTNEKNVQDRKLKYERHGMNNDNTFIKLYDILTSYPELTLTDRLVYSAIRTYCQMGIYGPNTCNPTNDTIGVRLGMSQFTISRSIAHLQELGIIALATHPKKKERVIKLIRDFAEVQPEQEEYEKEHPDSCNEFDDLEWFVEKKPVKSDDDFEY